MKFGPLIARNLR
jgi:putative transposase